MAILQHKHEFCPKAVRYVSNSIHSAELICTKHNKHIQWLSKHGADFLVAEGDCLVIPYIRSLLAEKQSLS